MEMQDQYPTCSCGQDHHYFTCECGSSAFNLNAKKKLICTECHNVFELSKVISLIKDRRH